MALVTAVFLAAELVTAVLFGSGPVPELRVVGAACAAGALPLMFLPMFTLRRYGQVPAGASYMHTTRVVERGLFAVVRHPQYTGYLLLAVTFALIAQHPVTVALAAAAAAGIVLWTAGEERAMREHFGAAYDGYASRVPRFNVASGLVRMLRQRRHATSVTDRRGSS